jgi:hypothetical protein
MPPNDPLVSQRLRSAESDNPLETTENSTLEFSKTIAKCANRSNPAAFAPQCYRPNDFISAIMELHKAISVGGDT